MVRHFLNFSPIFFLIFITQIEKTSKLIQFSNPVFKWISHLIWLKFVPMGNLFQKGLWWNGWNNRVSQSGWSCDCGLKTDKVSVDVRASDGTIGSKWSDGHYRSSIGDTEIHKGDCARNCIDTRVGRSSCWCSGTDIGISQTASGGSIDRGFHCEKKIVQWMVEEGKTFKRTMWLLCWKRINFRSMSERQNPNACQTPGCGGCIGAKSVCLWRICDPVALRHSPSPATPAAASSTAETLSSPPSQHRNEKRAPSPLPTMAYSIWGCTRSTN